MFSKNTKTIRKRSLSPGATGKVASISNTSTNRIRSSAKKTSLWTKLFFWILLAGFLSASFYLIFLSGFLEIREIEISGTDKISRGEVEKPILESLDGMIMGKIPRNNFILFPSEKVKKDILEKFKVINEIEIEKKFPNKLIVSVGERELGLILRSGNEEVVVDEKGIAFDRSLGNGEYLSFKDIPVLRDQSQREVSVGKEVLSPDYVFFVKEIRKKIGENLGISLGKEMETPSISSGDIRMASTEGWKLYLDRNLGIDKEEEMLEVVLNNKIEPERRADLEYIDLRIQNKVFYRFKNQEAEEGGESSENSITDEKNNDEDNT